MLILDKSSVGRKSSYIVIPDAADLTPSGDFTFEMFGVIFDSVPTAGRLYSHYNSTSPFSNNRSMLFDYESGDLRLVLSTDGTSTNTTIISYTWTPTTATEYDLCFDRSGSTVRIYVDGSMVASGTVSGALFNCTDVALIGAGKVGSDAPSSIFPGSCKAVRYTVGTARYATDTTYTVPSLPLPTSA